MANLVYEMDPVTHITAGAIGQPGERTFFVQALRSGDVLTLVCEKLQVQALADAIDEMVTNLEDEFGLTRHRDLTLNEADMALREPVDPLFRVGAMGLGYDANRDRIMLVAQEVQAEDDEGDPREVRFFATRAQMEAFSLVAHDAVSKGRPPEIVALQAESYVRRNGHSE